MTRTKVLYWVDRDADDPQLQEVARFVLEADDTITYSVTDPRDWKRYRAISSGRGPITLADGHRFFEALEYAYNSSSMLTVRELDPALA